MDRVIAERFGAREVLIDGLLRHAGSGGRVGGEANLLFAPKGGNTLPTLFIRMHRFPNRLASLDGMGTLGG